MRLQQPAFWDAARVPYGPRMWLVHDRPTGDGYGYDARNPEGHPCRTYAWHETKPGEVRILATREKEPGDVYDSTPVRVQEDEELERAYRELVAEYQELLRQRNTPSRNRNVAVLRRRLKTLYQQRLEYLDAVGKLADDPPKETGDDVVLES